MAIFDKYQSLQTGTPKGAGAINYDRFDSNKNLFSDYKPKYSVMGQPAAEEEETEEPGILSSIASKAGGLATGASQGIYQGVGNLVGAAGKALDYLNPVNITSKLMGRGPINLAQSVTQPFANASKDIGFRVKQTGESVGADTEGFAYGAGKFTGELAAQVPGMVFGGEALKGVQAFSKSKYVSALADSVEGSTSKYILEKLPNLAKYLNFGIKSVGSTELSTAATRGEASTKTELLTGLAIDGAASLLSYLAPKVFKFGVQPDAPGAAEIDKFKEIDKMADEATGKYFGTKRQIISKAENVITKSSGDMRKVLEPIKETYDPYKFINSVFERADEVKGQPQVQEAMLKQADDWLGSYINKPMTAVDLLEAKQNIGNQLANYFKKGVTEDLTLTGRKQALAEIWKALSDQLDEFSPEVAKLNRDMSIAYSIKGPLAKELIRKPKFAIKNILTGAFGGALVPTWAAKGMQALSTPIARQAEKQLVLPTVNEELGQ